VLRVCLCRPKGKDNVALEGLTHFTFLLRKSPARACPDYQRMTMVKGNKKKCASAESPGVLSLCGGVALLLVGLYAFAFIALKSDSSASEHESLTSTMHVAQVDDEIFSGTVEMQGGSDGVGPVELPYLHCGPRHTPSYGKAGGHAELLLLHGAKFTKEDWKTSGIMKKFCKDSKARPGFSVTALDLPISAVGSALVDAFDSLVKEKVLSGDPAVFVTPSASGKAMITMKEAVKHDGSRLASITDMIQMWIPVACGGVLKAESDALAIFHDVPVLAIYGSEDPVAGKKSSELLSKLIGAETVELKGRHPVYLDSPDEFVELIAKRVVSSS